jgi:hypothetical protein
MNKKIVYMLLIIALSIFFVQNAFAAYESQSTYYTNRTQANSGSWTYAAGVSFNTTNAGLLTGVTRYTGVTANKAMLFYGKGTGDITANLLATSTTLSGNTFLFNYTLTAGGNYTVLFCDNAAGTWTYYLNTSPSYPIAATNTSTNGTTNKVTYIAAVFGGAGSCAVTAVGSDTTNLHDILSLQINYTAPSVTNFTITATDAYVNTAIYNLTAIVNSKTYTTTNGTLVLDFLINSTSLYNITSLWATDNDGYLNASYTNYNVSGGALAAKLAQSKITFNAVDLVTGANISTATFNTSALTNATHYFNKQNYNISAVAANYYTNTIQYNTTALSIANQSITLANVLFNTSSNIYGTAPQLKNYSVIVTNPAYNFTTNASTTNGTLKFYLSDKVLYNLTVYYFSTNDTHFNYTLQNVNASQALMLNYTVLNLTVKDNLTTANINNITTSLSSTNQSGNIATLANTANPQYFYIYNNYNYTLRTSAAGYNSLDYQITPNTTGVYNYTVNLTANNSVLFYFYNSTSLNLINNTNISAFLTYGSSSYTCGSSTGSCLIANLTPNTYNIIISATGYNTLTGVIAVGNNTFQTYNAYLNTLSTLNTIFTITDQQTLNPIVNATLTIESRIPSNPVYTFVTALSSDIVGSAQLNYASTNYYRITVSAPGYNNNQFELKPIIYTAYEIRLTANNTLSVNNSYQNVMVSTTPSYVINRQLANFTYTITAPSSILNYYSYNVTTSYDNTVISGAGSNAYGGTLNGSLYVNTTSLNQSLYLTTTYQLTNGASYTTVKIISIQDVATSSTSAGAANNFFGLSIFDRMLIIVITVLMSAGMVFYFAGTIAGGAMAILVLGYFMLTGFMPIWGGAISIVLLVMLLARASA